MEVGLIRSINIDQEMQQAYLDYAMSVIVARALPDARDGLKPVHRRILYAMYDMGLRPETPYKKSARIVGEVLGKYHPHGDAAVYDAMARMAQDFSMRYMLVDGQGNFGSVDGDPPAAMRYTEARLAAPAINILGDIDKETVDFSDNFDGSLREPKVLPAALPNLLVNGATGIAVGMSTSIPPHNLGEVVDALKHMLDNWNNLDDISVEGLMRFIQGPDFPTGGVIVQDGEAEGLKAAYGTGRGRVTVQARAHVEEMERGRNRIIVTELPYMTNKSSLIERIADLVREGHLEGIADLRDESDRRGLRIVIELTRTAQPDLVLKGLYKSTSMRTTFGIIMLALVDGEPRLLSLKQALRVYLEHRLVIIKRRSEHDLARARRRAHILEGLRVALKNLDEVIDLIRKSPDAENARTRLMKRFKLSDIQSQAILDMPLRRLAALERKKIDEEYKEVSALIKSLEGLLRSSAKMRQVVAEDLLQVKEAYSDRRRTYITGASQASAGIAISSSLSTVPSQSVWVGMTVDGTIARTLDDRPPRTSGFAAPRWLLPAHTHDTLYLVSDQGEAAGVPVHALPEAENPAEGIPYWKVSALNDQDRMAAMFTLPPKENRPDGWFVFSASRHGLLKKTALTEMPGATARKFTLMRINPGDRLGWVRLTTGSDEIVLATCNGMAIRFSESEVRPMGLVVAGVAGIKLQKDDELAGMDLAARQAEIFLITTEARAKRVRLAEFPLQGRYGQGVLAWKQGRDSKLAGLAVGRPSTRLTVHLEKLAPKSFRFDEVPLQTRAASGKSILALKGGERVTGLTVALGESRHASATPPPQTPPRPPRRKPQVDGSEDGKPSPSSARVGQSKLGALTGSKSTPEKDGAGRRTSRVDAEGGLKTSPAHTAKKSPSKFAKPATTVDASSTRATKTRQSVTPGAGKTASSVQSSKPAEAKPSRPTAQPKTKTSPQTKLSTRSAKGAPLPPATRKKAAATLTERPSASTRRAPGTGAGSNPPIGKSSSPAKTGSRSPGAGLKASPSRGGTGRKSAPEAKSVKLHSTLTGSASKKSPATSAKPARGNTQVKAGDKARSGKKTSKPASGSSKSASGSSKPISGSSKTTPKGKATLVTKRSSSPAAPKAVTTKLKPAPKGKVKPSSKTPSSSAGSKPGASKPGPVATQKKGAAGKRGKPG